MIRGLAAFLGALAFCTCAMAQGGGWAAVRGIAPGSRVEVELARAKAVKGMLVDASASGMEVQESNGSTRRLGRGRITKVYLIGKAHKLRGGVIGAGAGGGSALLLYMAGHCTPAYSSDGCTSRWWYVLVGAAFAAVGAAVGAVIGSHHSRTLVYRRETANARPAARVPASAAVMKPAA
ncbi:MAG: hypothetical protein ACRD13_10985 [Terriglobales bacterium]